METELNSPADTAYGCLFCRSGREQIIAEELRRQWGEPQYLVPMKQRIRRIGKRPINESVPLFPGYIFVKTTSDYPLYKVTHSAEVFRLLHDDDHNWQLCGWDRAFAEKLFAVGGEIGLSKAYYVNERIHIVEGFLKDYEGEILSVNHRSKTAKIRLSMQGQAFFVWLGFELIRPSDEEALKETKIGSKQIGKQSNDTEDVQG